MMFLLLKRKLALLTGLPFFLSLLSGALGAGADQVLEGAPQYRLSPDGRCGYELLWRTERPLVEDSALIACSQGDDRPLAGPYVFNSIARRNPCFLASGDLPRFALGRVFAAPVYNPPLVKLGDLRIRCTVQGKSWWLDAVSPVKARFYPWGTIHELSLAPQAPLNFTITSTLVENRGMAVDVAVTAIEGRMPEVVLELFYGGLEVKDMRLQLQPCYFQPDPKDALNDTVRLTDGVGRLTDPHVKGEVKVVMEPEVKVVMEPASELMVTPHKPAGETANLMSWRHRFMATSSARKFRVLAWHDESPNTPPLSITQFDAYVGQTRQYYESLLAPYEVRTPDPLIDAAFDSAVVNLDYLYQSPGWYEGIHKWNSFFVNNYQISAALALGQMDRVKATLLFNAEKPDGPGQGLNSDGSVNLDMGPKRFDEGILYYILQLHRYWLATGDRATLDQVYKATADNLEGLFKLRDPDNNLLLNWHQGCNFFLYQADHLGLPGDALSPTIMTAHCLALMAELAKARGDASQAAKWRQRSDYLQQEALRRLWSPAQGKFIASIDPQGLAMQANYYTDFVFPQLYSMLPAEYAWLSLRTLNRTLWVGRDLMRVGNYKPQLFGNNNVMPVQMAEAAEAYCRSGQADEGARLLHGVARGVTICTDSPGSFPERMSDSGFGQPDYTFGNPAGSYVRGVTSGLFGLERQAPERPILWQPSLPEEWPEASIKLGEIQARVHQDSSRSCYELKLSRPQGIEFRLALLGRGIVRVEGNGGAALTHTVEAHPSGGMLRLSLPPATAHNISIVWSSQREEPIVQRTVKAGARVRWRLPSSDMTLIDPQQAMADFKIEGTKLRGRLASATGVRTVFLKDRQSHRMQVMELDFGKPQPEAQPPVLQGRRRALDLTSQFNGASINSQNFWRYGPIGIDLSKMARAESGSTHFRLGASDFVVTPSGNNMIVLEVGDLHHYTTTLTRSEHPLSAQVSVGERVHGLEFLAAFEGKTRLTGMEVGTIVLHYRDGSLGYEPLVYGRNLDCMTRPFATQTQTADLGNMNSIFTFSIQADASRVLDFIEIRLVAADCALGVLAINAVCGS